MRSLAIVPALVVFSACGAGGRAATDPKAPAASQPGRQTTPGASPAAQTSTDCISTKVTIRVRPTPGARPFCLGTPDCPAKWLEFEDPSGRRISLLDDWALPDCNRCLNRCCLDVDLCGHPFELPAAGTTQEWNGDVRSARTLCGDRLRVHAREKRRSRRLLADFGRRTGTLHRGRLRPADERSRRDHDTSATSVRMTAAPIAPQRRDHSFPAGACSLPRSVA